MEWDFVVVGYTEEQAIADGTLVKAPGPIACNGKQVNTVTSTLIKELEDHISEAVQLDDGVMHFMVWATLGLAASKAELTPDNPDGYMLTYNFRWDDAKTSRVWFLADGRGGYTAMRPEDY